MRFGRWTILGNKGYRRLCRCDCGTERKVVFVDIRNGRSRSCGCLMREETSVRSKITNRKHGMDATPTYRTWTDMKRRCYQPHRKDYKNYGGRGITVCDEWRNSFEAFLRDMGPRPAGKTLDRKDNNGPYCKDNCRWATALEQMANRQPKPLSSRRRRSAKQTPASHSPVVQS